MSLGIVVFQCNGVPRHDTTAGPTYSSGPFEFLEEPRHGERREDQAPGASLGRRGWSSSVGSRGQSGGSPGVVSTMGRAVRRQSSGKLD